MKYQSNLTLIHVHYNLTFLYFNCDDDDDEALVHLQLYFSKLCTQYVSLIILLRPDSSILSSFFSVNYWLLAGEASVSTQSSLKSLSPSEVKQRNALVKWIEVCNTGDTVSTHLLLNLGLWVSTAF